MPSDSSLPPLDTDDVQRTPAMKAAWTTLGLIFLGVGFIGAVLPVMPTTPFLLLAAACFMRGSDRLYRWLMTHPVFGRTLRAYRAGLGIPMRAKILAVSMIMVSFTGTIAFVIPVMVGKVAMAATGVAVIIYILTRPTWHDAEEP